MTRIDFESEQSLEILGRNDSYSEWLFTVNFTCIAAGSSGYFNPVNGDAEPPYGPEFDVVSVSYPVIAYSWEKKTTQEYVDITWRQFESIVGSEIAEQVFEAAYEDACENGGF